MMKTNQNHIGTNIVIRMSMYINKKNIANKNFKYIMFGKLLIHCMKDTLHLHSYKSIFINSINSDQVSFPPSGRFLENDYHERILDNRNLSINRFPNSNNNLINSKGMKGGKK